MFSLRGSVFSGDSGSVLVSGMVGIGGGLYRFFLLLHAAIPIIIVPMAAIIISFEIIFEGN
ncbi:MAG: hypothetical protein AB4426_27000 [Xenococcaceae cyanobacterium]